MSRRPTSEQSMTRRCFVALSLLAAGLATGGCSTTAITEEEPSEPVGQLVPARLRIILTGGSQGNVEGADDHVGLASVAGLRQALADDGCDVILLDAGDAFGGSDLVDLSDGEDAVGFMNAAGYDLVALGRRELALGTTTLATRRQQADFPLISANVRNAATGETLIDAHRVFTLSDRKKVGVFALTSPAAAEALPALSWQGLSIATGDALLEAAQGQVAKLRGEGCALVVCLSNLSAADADLPDAVAQGTSGIDVLLDYTDAGGGWHTVDDTSGEETLVVQAGSDLAGPAVVQWEHGTLAATLVSPDDLPDASEQVEALVTQASTELELQLAKTVATSPFDLLGCDDGARASETNLGDLVADALLWYAEKHVTGTSPDAALISARTLRASLPSGEIRLAELTAALPHQLRMCVTQVKGSSLLEALEAACAALPQGSDALPQVAGMALTVDTAAPFEGNGAYEPGGATRPAHPGARVSISSIGGRTFSANETYTLAMVEAIAAGTGAFAALADAVRDPVPLEVSVHEAVRSYLEQRCKKVVPDRYRSAQERLSVKAQPES